MSYRCEKCKKAIKKNVPMLKAVTKIEKLFVWINGKKAQRGFKIKKEKSCCPSCYSKLGEKR